MSANNRWMTITMEAAAGALLISLALTGLTGAAGPRSAGTEREAAVNDAVSVKAIAAANAVDEKEKVATTGTFTIAGTCRDEARQPLADVQVVLYRINRWPLTRCARVRETRTDVDGRYRFADIRVSAPKEEVEEDYAAVFTKHGLASQIAPLRPREKEDGQEVTMYAPSTLRGRVTDPEGKAVVGASVYARALSGEALEGFMSARTDADGRFAVSDFYTFPEGFAKDFGRRFGGSVVVRYPLRVRHPDYAEHVHQFQNVPDTFDITLDYGGTLEGRVVDSITGKPAANVAVTLRPTQFAVGDNSRQTETDEQGNYRVTGLGAAEYTIWASARDRTCAALPSVPVVAQQTQKAPDLHLIGGGWIEGRILTIHGQPVTRDPQTGDRLAVQVKGPARPVECRGVESCAVEDDGTFRIRVPPGRNYPSIFSSGQEIWNRTWRKEECEKGIDVNEGETVRLKFRVLDKPRTE